MNHSFEQTSKKKKQFEQKHQFEQNWFNDSFIKKANCLIPK